MLRWRLLEGLSLINFSRGQEFSGGPKSYTWVFHLGSSGLTLTNCNTKTLQASENRRQNPKSNGEIAFHSQEHLKRLAYLQKEEKKGEKG